MVVLFVVATIVLFLGIDLLLRKKKATSLEAASQAPDPLFKTLSSLPGGVFLQKGFTWTRILDDGSVAIGLHPILSGLTGKIDELTMLEEGEDVKRGQALMLVKNGKHQLRLASPVSGHITAVNYDYNYLPGQDNNWLALIKPTDVPIAIRSWMVADEAKKWSRERFNEIRDFFSRAIAEKHGAITMADGGDLPQGILQQFEGHVWNDFQKAFLNPLKTEK